MRTLSLICLLLFTGSAHAETEDKWQHFYSLHQFVGESSYTSLDILIQGNTSNSIEPYAFTTISENFSGLYAGAVFQPNARLDLGLGAGAAWYAEKEWFVINPWMYYEHSDWSMYAYTEYIPEDAVQPWFYQGYVQKYLTESTFAGLHAEEFFGIGPYVGTHINEYLSIQITVPVADKPSDDPNILLVSLSAHF